MVNLIKLSLIALPLSASLWSIPALAQVIPAADGTGTLVSPNGNQINILGGKVSADGANLFQSFEQFNLNSQQTATFRSSPQIQNILGRITGNQASFINGLLQVQGSNANLYLLNPAGIIFGSDARLDVPSSFTATTATRIGFSNGSFNSSGTNNYNTLVGNPQSFAFSLKEVGAIANLGNLAVKEGQNLALIGGTVLNTGTLSAPGGNITIAAVSGGNLLRISQDGTLLNLEIAAIPIEKAKTTKLFKPLSLPALLTGGKLSNANNITVVDDTIYLTREAKLSRRESPIANSSEVGTANVSGTLDVASNIGGSINIVGSKISLQNATLQASGNLAGGNVRIGGDFQGISTLPTATQTFIDSNSIINASALSTGNGGQVAIWADKNTRFDGTIQARGGAAAGNGGIVEVSGKETLVFRGNVDTTAPNGNLGQLLLDPLNIVIFDSSIVVEDSLLDNTLTIAAQKLESLTKTTNVTVQATNNIAIADLEDNTLTLSGVGSVTFLAGDLFSMNLVDTIQGSVNISADNLTVKLTTNNEIINVNELINTNEIININELINTNIGINVEITVPNGSIITEQIKVSTQILSGNNNELDGDTNVEPQDKPKDNNITVTSPNIINAIAANSLNVQPNNQINSTSESKTVANIPKIEPINLTGLNRETNSFAGVAEIEQRITNEFQQYLPLPENEKKNSLETIPQTRDILQQVETNTGLKPALLYVYFVPYQKAIAAQQSVGQGLKSTESESISIDRHRDTLEILLVTANGQPIRKQLRNVSRAQVIKTVQEFQQQVTDATTSPEEYLPAAQQLYNWIVAPIQTDLKRQGIENISFILDSGLRSIPIAALHDGKHFLVEEYSIGLMPSLSLTEFKVADIRAMKVLAMGASKFREQNTLPTVPIELSTISKKLWSGESLLNSAFTTQNLKSVRSQRPYGIVHLATHAEFKPGKASNSYIQFWDQKLPLERVRELRLNTPTVELLVLSACSTALGDEQAELGFAGMSLHAGVKSSLASLWAVGDEATLALMIDFYRHLRNSRTKVEALQQVQIAMLKGKIRVENGRLITTNGEQVALPIEVASSDSWNLTHPIYWSAFSLIGNPW